MRSVATTHAFLQAGHHSFLELKILSQLAIGSRPFATFARTSRSGLRIPWNVSCDTTICLLNNTYYIT